MHRNLQRNELGKKKSNSCHGLDVVSTIAGVIACFSEEKKTSHVAPSSRGFLAVSQFKLALVDALAHDFSTAVEELARFLQCNRHLLSQAELAVATS